MPVFIFHTWSLLGDVRYVKGVLELIKPITLQVVLVLQPDGGPNMITFVPPLPGGVPTTRQAVVGMSCMPVQLSLSVISNMNLQ